jgi:hypothetical protein
MPQYDNIFVTPVYGPLSHQYPHTAPSHNAGALPGRHPNPPQFYPADNSSQFANARYEYSRVSSKYSNTNGSVALAQSNKYIAPTASSMFTSARKRLAVGKSSYKQGLPDSALLSYKSYNTNDVKTALRMVRSSGSVAPKKKGAIQNTSLRNGQVCAWGSVVRQTY